MAKTIGKKRPATQTGWVMRSSANGQVIAHAATKQEAADRARFLAVASLSAVPKKSSLTPTRAKKAVSKVVKASAQSAKA
ncbi:hypothetical protein OF829_08030 [Sphingomonas sp. LB-2]|nr:hypothetical protein [Sphingomonas caeni]